MSGAIVLGEAVNFDINRTLKSYLRPCTSANLTEWQACWARATEFAWDVTSLEAGTGARLYSKNFRQLHFHCSDVNFPSLTQIVDRPDNYWFISLIYVVNYFPCPLIVSFATILHIYEVRSMTIVFQNSL